MKDAFWFQHDSNARTDARILELRAEMGWEGYGLWWALVEQLREATDYQLSNVEMRGLAMGLAVTKPEARKFVDLCIELGLLTVEGDYFHAAGLRRRMERWDTKRTALSEAGKRGAGKRWAGDKPATESEQPPQCPADSHPNGLAIATPLATPSDLDSNKRREEKSTEQEVLEGAAGAAPAPPEKKMGAEPLVESPMIAPHTEGGAADVGTRKRKPAKPKPEPGSSDPHAYELPEWATTAFVEKFAEWLATRQSREDCKPLQAKAVQARLNQLARYDEAFCLHLLEKAEQNPHWQGLTFDDTDAKFTQHCLTLQKLQADATRLNQPERGAKPTEAASYGARTLSAQLRAIREERAAQNGSHVHLGAAAGTHAGLGSPVPAGVGAPKAG